MRISVITPSFRSSKWLKLCVASVADQGVDAEHIVQDAGSDDGTLEWLAGDTRVKTFVEKDQGMYDAINRGLRRANGEILAYLNCDEQYLTGALQSVLYFFEQHPSVEVLFGDIILVDAHGRYLWHRKVQVPLKHHTWVCHLSTLSCAMFFRRKVVFDRGFYFDPKLRDVGDGEWMLRLLRGGVRMAAMGQFTSVFAETGSNMSAGPNARREAMELYHSAPFWVQKAKPLIVMHHRLRRLLGGMYFQKPFVYAIYTNQSPTHRVVHEVAKPTVSWWDRTSVAREGE